jgi:hypothetical protein
MKKEVVMRTKLIVSFIVCLFIAGQALAALPTAHNQDKTAIKGYITVDRNVVVLPERLQFGDRIDLFKANGARVLQQYVGNRYLSTNISNIPEGVYSIVIYRANQILATKVVPIMGTDGR